MPINIETSLKSIEEIFSSNYVYKVPAYQRSYTWDIAIACQLLDDLVSSFYESDRSYQNDYFIGTIVLCKNDREKVFEIVDGQQRLVTLLLILATLRDKLSFPGGAESIQKYLVREENKIVGFSQSTRVALRDRDQGSFQQWIGEIGSTRSLPTEGTSESADNVLGVLRAFSEEIADTRASFINDLFNFILQHCKCITACTDDFSSAHKIFKSVNAPGKKLSVLAQIRSHVFGSAPLNSAETTKLTDAWDFIEDSLGEERLEQYILVIASTLFSLKPSDDLYDIYSKITRDPILSIKFKDRLHAFISNYFDVEYSSLKVGEDSETVNRSLRCLNALNSDYWRSSALLWLAKNHTPRETAHFFRALEAVCLGMTILSYSESKKAQRIQKILKRIEAKSVIDSESSDLYLTNSERRKITEILEKPINARAKFLKPLLLRLNAEIADKNAQVTFPKEITIEHVLPQNPRSNSEWLILFPNQSERKKLCELLGNYALLSPCPNARGGNKPFREKKNLYYGLTENQNFALTSNIVTYENWTRDVIISRSEELRKKVERILHPFTM